MTRNRNSLEIKNNPIKTPRKSPVGTLLLAVSLVTGTIIAVKSDIMKQINSAKAGSNKEDSEKQYEKCMSKCESSQASNADFAICAHNCGVEYID